jgi:hypothetical protein
MTAAPAYADEQRGRAPRQMTEANSVMRVRGGDTVVIAGLSHEWGDAAAAGGTPGSTGEPRMRRKLVVLLTPTVVNAGSAPAGAQ